MKLDTIKISSGDITNAPLLINSAKLAKHIILSTGVSNTEEVGKAISALLFGFLNCQGFPTETILKLLKSPKIKIIKNKVTTTVQVSTQHHLRI